MTSNLVAMATNLVAMASSLVAMASNLVAMASNLVAMASNLVAMASNLLAWVQKLQFHNVLFFRYAAIVLAKTAQSLFWKAFALAACSSPTRQINRMQQHM